MKARQSKCRICGKQIRPGSGVVVEFGGGGRVHREKCAALAQASPVAAKVEPDHAGTYDFLIPEQEA